MTGHPAEAGEFDHRFPGFDTLAQAGHWDETTARLIRSRVDAPVSIRFFSPAEFATAAALIGQLVDQDDDMSIALCITVDARLADTETDGWHYDNMAPDGDSWHRALACLDEDANDRFATRFADLPDGDRHAILEDIPGRGDEPWHEFPAKRLWDLWMRYACTAYYAHPSAWNEIGFPGPAYPRGYKNLGIDGREPFEVRDAHPLHNPVANGEAS